MKYIVKYDCCVKKKNVYDNVQLDWPTKTIFHGL